MARFVIDASAAVEYLLRSPVGLTLGDTLKEAHIDAPEILDAEVMSTFRRHVSAQLLAPVQAERLLDNLAVWPINRISHRILTRSAWQYRHNVSAYDAMYVATAAAFNAPLLTADAKLTRAPNLGIAIHYVSLT